jgi:hypothetical protein
VLRALAALSSPLLIDDYLELVNPLWSTRELRGRIERIQPETPDAATVLIKPGHRWGGHEPGQYLRIGLDIEGVRHWRAYSLTSDPRRPDGLISITVKKSTREMCRPISCGAGARARSFRSVGWRESSCVPTSFRPSSCSSAPAAASHRS